MKLLFLIIGFAMSANAAVANDWRLTTYNDRGAALIDVTSIRQISASTRIAWSANVWRQTNERGADYSLLRHEYDCVAETITNVAYASYNAEGAVLFNENARLAPENVIPGSIGASTFRDVCSDNPQHIDLTWPNVRAFLTYFRSPEFNPGF
jgi:hypothetical protein